MPAIQVVVLSANGETRQSRITSGEVTEATVTKLCRKTRQGEIVATFEAPDDMVIVVWGWKEGKKGTENKHKILDDDEPLFGDIVVSMQNSEEVPQNLTVEQWSEFWESQNGNGDGDSDDDAEEEAEEAEEAEDVAEDEDEAEAEAEDDDEETEAEAEEEADDDGSVSGEDSDNEEEEGDEGDGEDGDCYEDGDGDGGGKRRVVRRRTGPSGLAAECRRMDIGLRSHIKVPMPLGKRAPRWMSAPELVEEPYTI